MVGPFLLQGMFEMRQPEVSVEFAEFIASRVLTPPRVLEGLCDGQRQREFAALVRANVPFIVPDSVVAAAVSGLRNLVGPWEIVIFPLKSRRFKEDHISGTPLFREV